MKIKVNYPFKVIVYKNPYIDFIDEDKDFSFEKKIYTDGLKFRVLTKIIEGNLIPDIEYQIFAYFETTDEITILESTIEDLEYLKIIEYEK